MTPINPVNPVNPFNQADSVHRLAAKEDEPSAPAAITCQIPSNSGTRQLANQFSVEESFVVASFQTALGHLSAAEVFARRTYGAHNPATEALRNLELQKKALLALLAEDHSST